MNKIKIMKTPLLIITLLIFSACSVVRHANQRFIPMVLIKHEYGLTRAQCDTVYKYAQLDSMKSYYNCGTDQRLYDPFYDYSIFRKK